jgi:hypothetical protein
MTINFTRWIEGAYGDYWFSLSGWSLSNHADTPGALVFSVLLLAGYAALLVRGYVLHRDRWLRAWIDYWLLGAAVDWLVRWVFGFSRMCSKAWLLLRPGTLARSNTALPRVILDATGRSVFLTGLPAALERAKSVEDSFHL